MRMTTYVNGPATVEVAWERYADPALWSTWAPQIRSVEVDQEGATRIRPGLTGTVHAAFGIDVRYTVTEVDEAARRWAWTARPPGFTMHLTHTVEQHPTGTRTGLAVDGPALVLLAYLPVARLALRRLVAR